MDVLTRLLAPVTGARAMRRWSLAVLGTNVLIVVTGAVVRLTSSGLGCPTWPRCTSDSFVNRSTLGLHGVIEFGNRLITFVLLIVAALALVTAWRQRGPRGEGRLDLRVLTFVVLAGIPLQGVIGGISVLTHLNPFVVALHLLASLALVAVATLLVRHSYRRQPVPVSSQAYWASRLAFLLACLSLWLGTVVTGSGPHAGSVNVPRTGFDGEFVTHLHAASVVALVVATLACVALLRTRAAVLLLLVELAQGVIGVAQYETGLPIRLVVLHLLGAALVMAAVANLAFSVRRQPAAPPVEPAAESAGELTAHP